MAGPSKELTNPPDQRRLLPPASAPAIPARTTSGPALAWRCAPLGSAPRGNR